MKNYEKMMDSDQLALERANRGETNDCPSNRDGYCYMQGQGCRFIHKESCRDYQVKVAVAVPDEVVRVIHFTRLGDPVGAIRKGLEELR